MKISIETSEADYIGTNYYFQFLSLFESGKAAFHKFFPRKIYQLIKVTSKSTFLGYISEAR